MEHHVRMATLDSNPRSRSVQRVPISDNGVQKAIEDRRTSQGLSVLSYARSQDGTTAAAMHAVCDAA